MPQWTRALILLVPLLLGGLGLGCADRRSPSDLQIQAHPESWLDPASEDFHGTRVANDGTAGCTSCHGADHRGEKRAPSCFDCHAHVEGWVAPADASFHGRAIAAGERCEGCHGADLRGGWSLVTCYGPCHPGPSGHPEGWIFPVSPNFHGTLVRAESAEACRACHGDDWRGSPAAEISCYERCHDGPGGHPVTWVNPNGDRFHGRQVLAEGTDDCEACHGAELDGGWAQVSCATACHQGAGGHPTGWVDPSSGEFHGDTVATAGADACGACHGDDFTGSWTGVGCFGCHDGPSGHPDGWVDPVAPPFHGQRVIDDAGPDACAACHGADYRGGWAELGCYESCHAGPSGHPAGWLDELSIDFHGSFVRGDGAEHCRECHGSDLRGDWAAESCYAPCHDGPGGHPPFWTNPNAPNFHGDAVEAAGGYGDCLDCHGADALGGWSGVSCSQCHDGPSGHPPGWMTVDTAGFHGQAVIDRQGYDSCTGCHGAAVDGGWSGVSCYGPCHDGPGGHPVDWYNATGPQKHDDAYYAEPPDACNRCHYGPRSDGWTGVGCLDCHSVILPR